MTDCCVKQRYLFQLPFSVHQIAPGVVLMVGSSTFLVPEMMMDNDALLLERYTRSRDVEAFATLTHRYAGMVYATALRLLRNSHDAEDVTQECFLNLARHPDAVHSSLPGWLHSLAISRAKDFLKSAKRRENREQAAPRPQILTRSEPGWEEIAPLVDEAIAQLPEEQRVAVIRHFLRNESHAEIAKSLGVSRSTITRRIQDGIESLRDRFGKYGMTFPAAALAAILYENSATAAPATLSAAVGKVALSSAGAAKAAAASGTTASIGTKIITGGVAMKLGISAAVAAAIIIGGIAVHGALGQKPPTVGATSGPVARQENTMLPPRPDNAALDYLLGALLVQVPVSKADWNVRSFLDNEFATLPPIALAERPDAAAFLAGETGVAGPLWALHEGALKTTCHFDIDWNQGPGVLVSQLAAMRNFAREALKIGNYKEFCDHADEAAEVDADIIRMGAHLADDPILMQGLLGIAVQAMGRGEAIGLLSRKPPREAITTLMDGLERVPPGAFKLDVMLRGEAEMNSNWFLAHPEACVLNYTDDRELTDEERANAERWAGEYQATMLAFAEAARGPYYESAPRLKALADKLDVRIKAEKEGAAGANPIIQFVPNVTTIQEKVVVADAGLSMLRIVTAAAMWKAETGQYPQKLDDLSKYFPKGVPKDPFTGKDLIYSLHDGLPRVECVPPKEVADAYKSSGAFSVAFSADLAERRQRDADTLMAWQKKNAEKK